MLAAWRGHGWAGCCCAGPGGGRGGAGGRDLDPDPPSHRPGRNRAHYSGTHKHHGLVVLAMS